MSDKENMWDDFSKIGEAMAAREKELDEAVEYCEYDMKLAVTRWVMKHIVDHANEGGSYRYLIYDRLGFGPDAYAPLCSSGLTISNEFDLNLKEDIRNAIIQNDMNKIKEIVGLCDVEGCNRYISTGWPSDEGYRRTCSEHYREAHNES